MNSANRPTILICLAFAYAEAMEKYRGINHYLDTEDLDWNIRLPYGRSTPSRSDLRNARREGLKGIILDLNLQQLKKPDLELVLNAGVPVVLVESDGSIQKPGAALAHVISSDADIGKVAADHLIQSEDYASFVFVGSGEGDWNRRRFQSFARQLKARGRPTPEFVNLPDSKLASMLRKVRKPVAVFAAADYVAESVFGIVRKLGLNIPGDVAVLGVDGEEIICNNLRPSLSSVKPNFYREGLVAAGLLTRMMAGKPVTKHYECRGAVVATRGSTGPVSAASNLVNRISDYLRAHYTEKININDIAKALKVSRRLLDRRYRQIVGESIMTTVERLRLNRVKDLLVSSKLSISEVAMASGFNSVNFMHRLFRRHFHTSPNQLRK